jgi:hypothetical protein
LEDAVFLPLCLVFLFNCYEGVSLLCLRWPVVSSCKFIVEGSGGLLAPFNSLVLETVTVSKAFVVASTAAMIAVDVLTHSDSECELLYSGSRLRLSHRLRIEPVSRRVKTSKIRVWWGSSLAPASMTKPSELLLLNINLLPERESFKRTQATCSLR